MNFVQRFLSLCLLFLSVDAYSKGGPPQLPVSVHVQREAAVVVQAFGKAVKTQRTNESASASELGAEPGVCNQHPVRRSNATGDASSRLEGGNDGSLNPFRIVLSASAIAHGGHYRTCTGCALGSCLGLHGNDTIGDYDRCKRSQGTAFTCRLRSRLWLHRRRRTDCWL